MLLILVIDVVELYHSYTYILDNIRGTSRHQWVDSHKRDVYHIATQTATMAWSSQDLCVIILTDLSINGRITTPLLWRNLIWATFCIKQKCVQIPPYLWCISYIILFLYPLSKSHKKLEVLKHSEE